MQPIDSSRSRAPHHRQMPPPVRDPDATPTTDLGPDAAAYVSELRLAAPALLVEARFGELTLASKLLRADEPGAFTIGPRSRADAPVNPAYLETGWDGGHTLIEPADGGFALKLTPAMRAELETPVQRLTLGADMGRVEAPLALPHDACLRVLCGEMVFELRVAEPIAAMPKPWLPSRWRDEGRYTLGVGLLLLALMLIVRSIPDDPHSLSLEQIAVSHRYLPTTIMAPEIPQPEVDKGTSLPGGSSRPAAKGPTGASGDPKSARSNGRRADAGNADPKDARAAAARVRANPMLALLDGSRGGDLAEVFADGPAMGADVNTVMGQLVGTEIANAYGHGGLGQLGTGARAAGEGEGLIPGIGPALGTMGDYGQGDGKGRGYGHGVGQLAKREQPHGPDIIPGVATTRGALDKEIIRRIVRRNINQVRYCYDQALAKQPTLAGRVVVQFTIAGSGTVLASVLASSTVGSPAVESCVVNAVKRWAFPAPEGGGLVIVSYPFQLTPAGS